MYQAKTARNKAMLMRRLVNMKLRSGKTVAEHTSEFQSLVNQLSSVDFMLGDEVQALLLLSSLPDSWETLVITLGNSAPNGILTMEMVKDALLSEEARRNDAGSDQTEALVTEHRGRFQGRNQSKWRGRSKSRGKSADGRKASYKCYYCGIEGHLKKNCRKLLREQAQNSKQPRNKDGDALVTINGEVALCTNHEETCLHTSSQDVEWVVDTAASYHVTPHRDFFTTYKAGDFGTVKMGNTSSAEIVGVGDVRVKTNVGCTITLKDVRHVPDLRLNLLSGIAFDKQGYDSYFNNGTWKMTKGSLIVARGHICGTFYKTHVKICESSLNIVHEETTEAEQKEEEEDIEQGETQSYSPEVAEPSQESDDGTPPEIRSPQVRRSEQGQIPSRRYSEFEYVLLTEEGEPENFKEARIMQRHNWNGSPMTDTSRYNWRGRIEEVQLSKSTVKRSKKTAAEVHDGGSGEVVFVGAHRR